MAKLAALSVAVFLVSVVSACAALQLGLRCSYGTFKDGTHYVSCDHGIVCWVEDGDCTVMP